MRNSTKYYLGTVRFVLFVCLFSYGLLFWMSCSGGALLKLSVMIFGGMWIGTHAVIFLRGIESECGLLLWGEVGSEHLIFITGGLRLNW